MAAGGRPIGRLRPIDGPGGIGGTPHRRAPIQPAHCRRRPCEILSWDQTQKRREQFAGKVVVLDVWSTYCDPCVREFPNLVKLQDAVCESSRLHLVQHRLRRSQGRAAGIISQTGSGLFDGSEGRPVQRPVERSQRRLLHENPPGRSAGGLRLRSPGKARQTVRQQPGPQNARIQLQERRGAARRAAAWLSPTPGGNDCDERHTLRLPVHRNRGRGPSLRADRSPPAARRTGADRSERTWRSAAARRMSPSIWPGWDARRRSSAAWATIFSDGSSPTAWKRPASTRGTS